VTQPAWSRREPPLRAAAVAATGDVLSSLQAATIACLTAGAGHAADPAGRSTGAPGQELRAVAGDGWLVVLGDDLPWADGAIYLGWDSGILVPTTSAPAPPAAILRAALPAADLVVLLPDRVLVSPTPVRPADPALLRNPGSQTDMAPQPRGG